MIDDTVGKKILLAIAFFCLLLLVAAPSAVAQNCWGVSVGFKPITELGSDTYKGYSGGLYLGGRNERPWVHDTCGRAFARQIQPLDRSGTVDPVQGRIVLLSIGMSNTTQEFSAFKSIADKDPNKNPKLMIVDGAQGGQTAALIADPSAGFWVEVERRLLAAGVGNQQVQIVWLKEADANPTQAFPTHALLLQSELENIVRLLKSRYPNLKITYVSSRTYAGYATSTLNPEPYAYESGFAVKWMIERQIGGDTSLAFSGSRTRAPWLSWGPYLWADGMTPRVDRFIWQCGDCQADGTHPSSSGQAKVANLLLSFFKTDPTAIPWFVGSPGTSVEDQPSTQRVQFHLHQNYPNPFNPETAISFQLLAHSFVTIKVYDLLGREVSTLVDGIRMPGSHAVRWDASGFPSGIYFCRLEVRPLPGDGRSGFIETRKMVLAR
ncbi:MAG: T9SS type A sorting domain-containing protein [Ignavibacteriales bacterium]|nr:T9SS type A sorting domain-containing protein [Ignavibacteriales bacterium]